MMSPMSVTGGPYLAAAVFCEKALREADGVLSLIRIVDKWTVRGTAEVMPQTVIQATLVVMMKSGSFRGSAQLTLTPTSPSGKIMPSIQIPVIFEGDDDRGIGAIAPMGFPAEESGIYWFDLVVEGQSFTKLPLRVQYLRVVPSSSSPNQTNQ